MSAAFLASEWSDRMKPPPDGWWQSWIGLDASMEEECRSAIWIIAVGTAVYVAGVYAMGLVHHRDHNTHPKQRRRAAAAIAAVGLTGFLLAARRGSLHIAIGSLTLALLAAEVGVPLLSGARCAPDI